MSSPVKLGTPYPTMDEVAKVYGISPTRLEELKRLVDGLMSRRSATTALRSFKCKKGTATARKKGTARRIHPSGTAGKQVGSVATKPSPKNSNHAHTGKRAIRKK